MTASEASPAKFRAPFDYEHYVLAGSVMYFRIEVIRRRTEMRPIEKFRL